MQGVRGRVLAGRCSGGLRSVSKRRFIGVFVSALIAATACVGDVVADVLALSDKQVVKQAFLAAERGQWVQTRRLAAKVKEPVAEKLLAWLDYSWPGTNASFSKIAAFVKENPDWPKQETLKNNIEEAMPVNFTADEILDWFDCHNPSGDAGWTYYGNALLTLGRKSLGRAVIRETWIEGNFTKREARRFYNRFRRILTLSDNRERLDRLIWEGHFWPARRMLWRVDKDTRLSAEARLLLMRREGNVDIAIARVPQKLKSGEGLVYERVRWRRRKGRYESAMELLNSIPKGVKYPNKWWLERAALARQALKKGHVTDAYRIARDHGMQKGVRFADAEWLAGWIALRFLNNHASAKRHFTTLYAGVEYPVSRARGAYWVGRTEEESENNEQAQYWYRVAAAFPTTFYGQFAANALDPGVGIKIPDQPVVSRGVAGAFKENELVRAVLILSEVGEVDRLRPFIMSLNKINPSPGWSALTAALAQKEGRLDLAIRVAKEATSRGHVLMEAGYPIGAQGIEKIKVSKGNVELSLLLAVIRQESEFYTTAKSSAGARGLMQILPSTARFVARDLKLRYSRIRLTSDPEFNIALGEAYLADLIDEFDGSYVLALAAYNAGPGRARQWIKLFGHPADEAVNAIDWVESIPFVETRNYIQRVLENLQIYRRRLNSAEVAASPESDLRR
jgi:soluble lytic murein transglycosylase